MAEPNVPANFNALYNVGARATRGVRGPAEPAARRAVERLAAQVPAVDVDLDEATRNPIRMGVNEPRARLSPERAGSPEEAAKAFVRDRADLWQLSDADLDTVEVLSTSDHGLTTVRLRQQVDGVEVFLSDMTAAVSADNAVVSVAGQLFHDAGAAATHAAARASGRAQPCRRARGQALDRGGDRQGRDRPDRARLCGRRLPPRRGAAERGGYRFYAPKWSIDGKASKAQKNAKPRRAALRAAGAGQRRAVPARRRPFRARLLHRALDPRVSGVQLRDRRRRHAGRAVPQEPDARAVAFKYRVHNTGDASSAPRTARRPARRIRPACPTASRRRPIAEKLIEIESLLPGGPWLPPDATTTRGNNCIAYRRPEAPTASSAGDVVGKVTAPRTFGAKYDHASRRRPPEPAEQHRRDVLPRELAPRPLVRGRLRRGLGQRPAGQLRARRARRRPDPGRGQRLQRHRQRQHGDAGGRRQPAHADVRIRRPQPAAQPHQQSRGADHVPRDGPLHHQPPGRQRDRA